MDLRCQKRANLDFSRDLEQVHVRSFVSRGLRLELVAGIGIALALPALALPAGNTQGVVATQTSLTAETRDQGGRTQVTLDVSVASQDGNAATGAVVISDKGRQIAGVALDAEGHAETTLYLPGGDHALTATYSGDGLHRGSVSLVSPVRADSSGTPDFGISVSPATLTLTQGTSGSITASIAPVNSASLTAPMFVTLSCAGLPDLASCTFTPENLEIEPNTTAAVTSSMVITTSAGTITNPTAAAPQARPSSSPVAWAVLLPGVLGLGGLAFGARRRRWLSRLSLLALVGLVTVLGTAACAPLYYYKNHGPPHNLPTPVGNYTIQINAQSSNGISATTHSTTMVLTVQ